MTGSYRTVPPWMAAAGGGVAVLGVQSLWGLALSSVGSACACLLAAAALVVLLRSGWLTVFGLHELRFLCCDGELLSGDVLPASTETWLRRGGAAAIPDAEIEGFIRAGLSSTLTPRPQDPHVTATWDADPIWLLSVALCMRATKLDWMRGNPGSALLGGLRDAMRHPPGEARDALLGRIGKRLRLRKGDTWDGIPEPVDTYMQAWMRHGTRESLLLALLDGARRDGGPLPVREFAWLKDVDRPLWYALDNLGRTTFHVEGIAAIEHYRAEVRAGKALSVPQVDGAVAALSALCREMRRKPSVEDAA